MDRTNVAWRVTILCVRSVGRRTRLTERKPRPNADEETPEGQPAAVIGSAGPLRGTVLTSSCIHRVINAIFHLADFNGTPAHLRGRQGAHRRHGRGRTV